MAVTVRKGSAVGNQVLPSANAFTPAGTRATVTTTQLDGVLEVGQTYWINVTPPAQNVGTYTAKYVDVDVMTYKFDNLHNA